MNKLKARVSGFAAVAITALLPKFLFAQGLLESGSFEGVLGDIGSIINDALIPVISALALVAFFVGLAMYVFNPDDEEGKERGKQTMIAGIVALFLMAAIGGIISFLTEATGTDNGEFEVTNPIEN